MTVELMVMLEDDYIIDQLVAIYQANSKILLFDKNIAVLLDGSGTGARVYHIEFKKPEHILEFGFDFGKCASAAEIFKPK